MVSATPNYSTKTVGLGADGYDKSSMVGLGAGGAFLTEVVLTFLFVFVVLVVTRKAAGPSWVASPSVWLSAPSTCSACP